jgi:1-acyl-sn-glycerol-3-phosphate acyltransferase
VKHHSRRSVLYDAVGLGMLAFSRARFDVQILGFDDFEVEPGTLFISTHRSDYDVPLICGVIYPRGRMWRRRQTRPWFAVRDDLFLPGFFAGHPPGISPNLRRVLHPIRIGRALGLVQCLPIRSPDRMRLVELLRSAPQAELARVLPPDRLEALRRRARELRLAEPRLARDVLRAAYADLLWTVEERRAFDAPEFGAAWQQRRRTGTGDFRALAAVLARGDSLLLFPEGRPSPEGEIGPLQPGVGALVRRGSPRWLRPFAVAYDPLTRGRPRVYVAAGPPASPASERIEETVLALLRRTTPLTPGQLVARSPEASLSRLERDAAAEVELALAEGRPFEPGLADSSDRRRLLEEARAARRRSALARLAREYASARVREPAQAPTRRRRPEEDVRALPARPL